MDAELYVFLCVNTKLFKSFFFIIFGHLLTIYAAYFCLSFVLTATLISHPGCRLWEKFCSVHVKFIFALPVAHLSRLQILRQAVDEL